MAVAFLQPTLRDELVSCSNFMNNIEEFEKELEKLAKKIQQEVDECRDADLTDWIKEEIKIFIQKWEA